MGPDNFHILRERVRITGILETRTALHIGGGDGLAAESADQPILRDALDRPFIPGSSLKGVLRSNIEGLLRAIDHPVLWACDPLSKAACGRHETQQREAAEKRIPESCAMCRTFGSPVLASHVRITDALLIDDADGTQHHRTLIERRDGVAIDRDLGVVSGKQKYDFEVAPPGLRFHLEVFVENPEPWTLGLLISGFDQLSEGFAVLGGYGSRGLGRVALEIVSVQQIKATELLSGNPPMDMVVPEAIASWRKGLAETFEEA